MRENQATKPRIEVEEEGKEEVREEEVNNTAAATPAKRVDERKGKVRATMQATVAGAAEGM